MILQSDVEQNEIIVCPDCGVDLEVINLDPITINLAPMEEEDWGE
ncbi:MAG: lysine biosynthesis protein LysW [Chloroflexi bacterium HGW-Chloroflexi-8]|nr:MAG: lysine biosynthesis protein LysW [Chloroflexi bacterium HGW-Chloroflexi-8]